MVTLTATPATGWHFAGWSGDATGFVNPLFVTMDGPKAITASFAINTYALSVSTSGSGTIAKSPDQPTYNYGTAVTLTAVPGTGWHLVGWSGDATGSANPLSVTMDRPKNITATFAINTYALNVTVSGSGTVTKNPDQAQYDHGTIVQLTAVAATGWHFTGWSGDTTSADDPLALAMTRTRNLTASFAIDTYPLDTSVSGSGSIARSPNQATYNYGTNVQLAAVPATGWHFLSWSGDLAGSTTPQVLTIDGPKSVAATFAINTYTLGVTVSGSGSVTKSPSQSVYVHGTVVQLTATPATGWHFVGWSGDASGSANPLSLTMDAPKVVTASFAINSYALTVTSLGGGSVSRTPDQPSYDYGTVVTLTATPAVGYNFAGWSGAVTGTTNPVSLTMDGPKSVTATFTLKTYTLATSSGPNGSIVKSPDQPLYTHGTVVQLTAVPATGYHLAAWGGDASGSASPINVTMDGDKSITATFAINTYALNVTVVGAGTVTKSPGQATYTHGQTVTLTAAAGANYHFTGWSGDATGATSPITVTMDSDKNITATFDINTFAIATAVTPAGSGTIAKSPDLAQYPYGSSVQLSAVPATGYRFLSWSGDVSGTANPATLTVDGAKTVTVTFAINSYSLTITKIGQGNVNKSPNQSSYTYGTIVSLSANASGGYRFAGWSGDTTATSNPLPLPMIANRNITARFVESQPPVVTVLSPNGGNSWTVGQAVSVTWTATDNLGVTAVDVLLGRAGPSAPFDTLASGVPNSGSINWVVKGAASTNAYVVVRVYDAAGNVASDASDSAFTIVRPVAVESGPVTELELGAVAPNPTPSTARMVYALPREMPVRLSVMDIQGREVAVLAEGVRGPGRYEARWEAAGHAAGVYFVRFEGGGRRLMRRLVVSH